MPDLVQSLQGRDLGHLRIIAELWGLDFDAPDTRIGLGRLAALLLDEEQLLEVVQALPDDAGRALKELRKNEGRIPWALFTRRYGAVREMGAAKRDRERPYLNNLACATEALWYRGLIAHTFFDTETGPEEFAYIPDDLLALIPIAKVEDVVVLGHPATPLEKAYPIAATDGILDDACTLLAGIRQQLPDHVIEESLICGKGTPYPLSAEPLKKLLRSADLLSTDGTPKPESIRKFLEAGRVDALAHLVKAWLDSQEFNELRLIPNLESEGKWQNDPLVARGAILDFISSVPGSLAGQQGERDRPYWSLRAFISAIHQSFPDYQRPAGDYDSWYLRDKETGNYLRGFECWDEVDGALVRFVIGGPLYWLGVVELSLERAPEANIPVSVTAFRFSNWAHALLDLKAPSGLIPEDGQIIVQADGIVRVPHETPRAVRYQIARFSEWNGYAKDFYVYQLSAHSLEIARKQGLHVPQLIALLRRHAKVVPPKLAHALERWETNGSEIRLDQVVILRVNDPQILKEIQASKAARFLGEILNPKMVIIRPGAQKKIASILAELGYLVEIEFRGEEHS